MPITRALSSFLAGVLVACVTSAAEPSGTAIGAERFPRGVAVKCGNKECGLMVISRYRNFRDGDPTPTQERYGASIGGGFRPLAGSAVEFHYLQVLTHFEGDDFRWIRDQSGPLPVRHVDPPPFGATQLATDAQGHFRQADHEFDTLPWFDEGDFPAYIDQPRAFLTTARRSGAVSMQFETWLVCVISARSGPDKDAVGDDQYEVAALVGWKWGFDIAYRDVGRVGVDELEDYTYVLQPFQFLTTPSEDFNAGLGTTVGERVADRFDIRFGDSAQCLDRER